MACIVTGASGGLGKALAVELYKKGHDLALLGRNEDRLKNALNSINPKKNKYCCFSADLSNYTEVETAFKKIFSEFKTINLLINNAGTGSTGPAEEITPREIERVMGVNFNGLVYATKQVIPKFKEQKHGTIINIASNSGLNGYANASLYCASKHAVVGFSRAIKKELKPHNISVMTICPGAIKTEFWNKMNYQEGFTPVEKNKILMPNDLAELIIDIYEKKDKFSISELEVLP